MKVEDIVTPDGARPRLISDLEIRAADSDTLVYDREGAKVHVLNATAAFVLALCDGSRTLDEIAAQLSDHYGVDDTRGREDVESIVSTFNSLGLLTY